MYHLDSWEEVLGILKELKVNDGVLFAQIGKVSLMLPLEMEEKMRPHVGEQVRVLRTDILGKQYLFRVIPDQGLNDRSGDRT